VITCVVEYTVDPAKLEAFERFGRAWIALVNDHGGHPSSGWLTRSDSQCPSTASLAAIGGRASGTAKDAGSEYQANSRLVKGADQCPQIT
jgi:hypothetical protein